MTLLKSPEVTIRKQLSSDPSDIRLKNIVWSPERGIKEPDVIIIGIPFDFGVKLSNGRIGAAKAPTAIRTQIKKYGTAYNVARCADFSTIKIVDYGDINVIPRDVTKTHVRVTDIVKALLRGGNAIIVLGGGNDLTFATVRALSESRAGEIGGMSVDAHLDVREVRNGIINSGTPYRRLIEHGLLRGENMFEVGIQGHVNSKAHWDWAKEQGIRIFTLDHTRQIQTWGVTSLFRRFVEDKKIPAAFVSIDIDSVAQAFAPGSSAPSPDGLFPKEILEIAYTAGTMPQVRLFEIMEVNPLYDQDNRTSRLAVNIILEFLAGYTQRKKSS